MSGAENETIGTQLERSEESCGVSEVLEPSENDLDSGKDVLVYLADDIEWINPLSLYLELKDVPDGLASKMKEYDDLYVLAEVPWVMDIRRQRGDEYEKVGRVKPDMVENPEDIESLPYVGTVEVIDEVPITDGGTGNVELSDETGIPWSKYDDSPYQDLPFSTRSLQDQK